MKSKKNSQPMKEKDERTILFELLSNNKTFRLPSKDFKGFRKVVPIKGKGVPASELLIKDRR